MSDQAGAVESANAPRPIPLTRHEMKENLEDMNGRALAMARDREREEEDISFNRRLMQMIADDISVMIGEVIERDPETDAIIGAAMDVATNGRVAELIMTMSLLF